VQAGRLLSDLMGRSTEVAVRAWDGSRIGPSDAPATIVIRSPAALARLVRSPGQLGLGRAYVTGEIDVEGDIFRALDLPQQLRQTRLGARHWLV